MRTIHNVATAAAALGRPPDRAWRLADPPREDAYASGAVTTDRSGAYYYGPQGAQNAQDRAPVVETPSTYNRGQNLPFADRPHGDPDTW